MDLKALYEPLETYSRRGPGGNYPYAKGKDVFDRMNKSFEGKWETAVKSQEIVEDEIIVRVAVTVHDGDKVLSQEGFGGSSIARNRETGKAIDVGNDYKSALTTAIKDACRKWGLALYLEKGNTAPVTSNSLAGLPTSGVKTGRASSSLPNTSNIPKVSEPVQPPPLKKDFIEVPVPTATPVPDFPPFPPAPKAEELAVVKEEKVKKSTSPFPSIPIPKAEKNTTKKQNAPPSSFSKAPETPERKQISDVQKAALNGLLNIKGVDYKKLASEAFSSKGMDVSNLPDPEDLSYKEAVVIIKYGNDVSRNDN